MKKFFTLMAALFAAFTLVASDEAQIRETILNYRTAVLTFDFNQALAFCTADYVEFSPDGTRRDLEALRQMAAAFRIMEQSNDLEVVMECAMKLQGAALTAAQRQQLRTIKGTPRETEVLNAVKQQMLAAKAQMLNLKNQLLSLLIIRDIKINGNEATAIQEFNEPGTGKKHITNYKLRKVRGKWMIYELTQENPA